MSFVLSFLVFSVVATVYSTPVIDIDIKGSCNADMDNYPPCAAVVGAPAGCSSTIVNLTNTIFSKCSTSCFIWLQPDNNNMTFIIETPFTQARQAYNISLANSILMEVVLHVYRILNNRETEVTTHGGTLVQVSDSNYQVILKFQGPPNPTRPNVIIVYDAFKM